VQALADLRPHAVRADEHVGISLGAVRESGHHAAAVAEVFIGLDA